MNREVRYICHSLSVCAPLNYGNDDNNSDGAAATNMFYIKPFLSEETSQADRRGLVYNSRFIKG